MSAVSGKKAARMIFRFARPAAHMTRHPVSAGSACPAQGTRNAPAKRCILKNAAVILTVLSPLTNLTIPAHLKTLSATILEIKGFVTVLNRAMAGCLNDL